MKKYIVLSVNNNPDYLFHVAIVCWAWKHFGWEPIIFFYGKRNTIPVKLPFEIAVVDLCDCYSGYEPETITQVSRLYGASIADGYLMTGDIDMVPLSDYWKPDEDKLTVYGRDLTDYHYPICYIGAPSWIWREVMRFPVKWDDEVYDYNVLIKKDLDSMPQAKSTDKVKRWVTDQDLITERINSSSFVPERVDRGTDKRTGYPVGRIDRSNWRLDHSQYIDGHMFHDVHRNEESFKKTLNMLHTVFPKEDFAWWVTYYKEFKKLCQNKSQFAA